MIITLLAEGFEEIEALTPVDVVRRAGIDIKTVGITGKTVTGSHGITVVADLLPDEVDISTVDGVIFPGGMPGATNLDAAAFTDAILPAVLERGGLIAAICAAPLVLGRRGLLRGKRATSFPGFEGELVGANVTGADVERDGNVITGRGMDVSLAFAREILLYLQQNKA